MKDIKLGSYVRDTISLFTGTVVCRAEWLNGCVRYSVQPRVDKDGKLPDPNWIDEQSCEVINEDKAEHSPPPRVGGPRNDPARSF